LFMSRKVARDQEFEVGFGERPVARRPDGAD
jgi:hypothetical protein